MRNIGYLITSDFQKRSLFLLNRPMSKSLSEEQKSSQNAPKSRSWEWSQDRRTVDQLYLSAY